MKEPLFTGVCTAMVTPFLNGSVNYPMLDQLLLRQINSGIDAIAVCGTTGEAATLSDEEKISIISRSKFICGRRCPVIAGTGSNNTAHAVALSIAAQEAGADGLLVISPYCNKANTDGLIAHYSTIAAAVRIPIIIYNVPSRTGVDIPPEVYKKLSTIENIIGVKEASTDIGKTIRIRHCCPPDFYIWSGNDYMTVPIMALGGVGVISVSSNVIPKIMHSLAGEALNGDFAAAAFLQEKITPLQDALFCDINPIPVKEAMAMIGYDCGNCRLPLMQISGKYKKQLVAALDESSII